MTAIMQDCMSRGERYVGREGQLVAFIYVFAVVDRKNMNFGVGARGGQSATNHEAPASYDD